MRDRKVLVTAIHDFLEGEGRPIRCILPDILAFYESIEGQREFEEWKKQQQAEQKE